MRQIELRGTLPSYSSKKGNVLGAKEIGEVVIDIGRRFCLSKHLDEGLDIRTSHASRPRGVYSQLQLAAEHSYCVHLGSPSSSPRAVATARLPAARP